MVRRHRPGISPYPAAAVLAALLGPAAPIGAWAQTAPSQPASLWQQDTLTGDWGGVRTRLQDAGVTLGVQEQSEVWGNLAGGLRTGAVYDGLTTASVKLDLAKLAGWTGATFFVSADQIHGSGPTPNLTGNLQPVSGVEATAGTKLYDLWLEQTALDGRLSVRVGQEGADDELMITQYGALYLNSSFGFPALAALDLPSGGPNYPLATPFVRVQWQPAEQLGAAVAVFNGDPAPAGSGDPQQRDAGGTAFRLNGHALVIGELRYAINQGDNAAGLPGTYKLGGWYHSGHFADQRYATNGLSLADPASSGVPRGHTGDYALYGIIDQQVWRDAAEKGRGIGVFFQAMGAPAAQNLSNLFIAGGVNWLAPFAGRSGDTAGFAVSYLGISPAAQRYGSDAMMFTGAGTPYRNNETVLELTYLCQLAPWWSVQPDVQYVINPGAAIPSAASRLPLKNAFVVGGRTTVTF